MPLILKEIRMAKLVIGSVLEVPVFCKFISVQLSLEGRELGCSEGRN
tara:strand:- start:257 stop:397 length:141 start_codon:yes stop_codon:yes gene_type:complete